MKLVSVVIPTYRGALQIKRAIDSVLFQTYHNIEIIIVDDNEPKSEERLKTKSIIDSLRCCFPQIRYIQHERNMNGAVARNTGIFNAHGEYITFLDDDDFLLPTRIENAVNFLNFNEEYSGVYSSVIFYGNKIDSVMYAEQELQLKDLLLNEMAIGTGSNIFIKSECIQNISGFDIRFVRNQDIEFMIRILKNNRIGNIFEFGMVKCQNIYSNIPSYKKMLEVKLLFNEKFKAEIESLNFEEQRQYYDSLYSGLYNIAVKENIQYAKKAKEKILSYRKLHIKEIVKFIMCKFNILKPSFLNLKRWNLSYSVKKKTEINSSLIYSLYNDDCIEVQKILKN